MNIILVGPPGTGKGTMAKLVEKEFGFKHISAGDLLREEVKNNSVLGRKAAPIMKAGKLVDDRLVAEIVSSNVSMHLGGGFVLDGFPRNLNQAKILEGLFSKAGIRIDLVLLIETDAKTIVKRLGSRRQCPLCNRVYGENIPPKNAEKCDFDKSTLVLRDDDRPQVIEKRLELYRQSAQGLLDFYEKKGLVKKIDGNIGPQKVFEEVAQKIRETGKQ